MKARFAHCFFVFLGLFLSMGLYAQEQKVSIAVDNRPLAEFIRQVENQTGYKFFYETGTVDTDRKISINVKNASLQNALSTALSQANVSFSISGKRIILSPAGKTNASMVKLTGVVLDEAGEPVIGASVFQSGTSNGVVTGLDGKFTINVSSGSVLEISSIGYLTERIQFKGQANLSVTLKEDIMRLEDVIVVGYGSEKRLNLTGSVASVSSKVLENRPISNLMQGLQGAIGNLNISQASGEIGATPTYNIRGISNLTDVGPLILIDGVEGDPNMVNPADVKDVVVLKDAASAAIYGAKAAYGVILITTKNGSVTEKPVIQFSGNYSINTPTVWAEQMSGLQFHTFLQDLQKNTSGGSYYNEEEWSMIQKRYVTDPENTPYYYHNSSDGEGVYRYLADTDWVDVLNKKYTGQQQYNLNVSGGSKGFKYYSSVGYYSQEGHEKYYDDVYNRITNINKLSYDVNKWLQVAVNTTMTLVHMDVSPEYQYQWSVNVPCYYPVKNPDGTWAGYDRWTIDNPAQVAAEGGNTDTKNSQYAATGLIKITPFKGMEINADYTYKFIDDQSKAIIKQYYWYDMNGNLAKTLSKDGTRNSVTDKSEQNKRSVFNIYGTYTTSIAGAHNIKAMAGFTQEYYNTYYFSAKRYDLVDQDIAFLSQATGDMIVSDDNQELALRGLFYRLNYNYKEKYLLELNGRYDGSSRFPKGNRFQLFPSASAAWRISKEPFWEPLLNTVNDLKFRASWGSLGNQVLTDYYPYVSGMTASNVIVNGQKVKTFTPGGLVSDDLSWETVNTLDFGLDATFFGNRMNASFDWYNRQTLGALTKSKTLPAYIAVTEPLSNATDLKTQGWELQLGWRDSFDNGLSYSVTGTLSDCKTIVTAYDNPNNAFSDYYVGQTLGEIWGFKTLGIFQSDEEAAAAPDQKSLLGYTMTAGDLQYVDTDGDGVISFGSKTLDDHGDMVLLGNSNPRYSYSLNGTLSWKGLDFNVMLQGVGKKSTMNTFEYVIYDSIWSVPWDVSADYWTPENTDAHLPKPMQDVTYTANAFDRVVWDTSYLRVKNLSLGYTIPARFTKKADISALRIFFSGDNLFTIKNCLKYVDPEMNEEKFRGINKSYSFGINITL